MAKVVHFLQCKSIQNTLLTKYKQNPIQYIRQSQTLFHTTIPTDLWSSLTQHIHMAISYTQCETLQYKVFEAVLSAVLKVVWNMKRKYDTNAL